MTAIKGISHARMAVSGGKKKKISKQAYLVSRIIITTGYNATINNVIVPANATFCVAHALGPGGIITQEVLNSSVQARASGGSLMVGYFQVFPGETLLCEVYPSGTVANYDTTVKRGVATLIRATKGIDSTLANLNPPAPEIYRIRGDDLIRSGQAGTILGGSTWYGGAAATDIGDYNMLYIYNTPPYMSTDAVTRQFGSGYGFGGVKAVPGIAQNFSLPHGGGVLWLEFFTMDPRNPNS